jgi:serine/threonine-protein kinase
MKEVPVKVGEILAGKYRVDSVLGYGGMGVVVEATHLELHETRAIKLMLPEALEEKEMVSRFKHEARAVVRLTSEHVARVHDVGTLESGLPYMVMEYLRGSDLRTIIKERGRIPAAEAVQYALQICEALAEAHALGIVHRDLKPANLFLITRVDGTPCIKVLDFGISKMLGSGDDEMTKTQTVLGSPSYMSPEQMRSARTVDARTDIWSLGVILYRLVTGELPFRGDTITELVTKVLQTAPRPPSTVAPDIPPELDEVLLRCMERDLSRRYATMGELSAALLPFAPNDARPSVERIARVLATASGSAFPAVYGKTLGNDSRAPHAPQPPGHVDPHPPGSSSHTPARGSSGDAWVNTPFGNGTIAVRKWKLWALGAAAGALALGGGVSIFFSQRASGASAPAQAATAPLTSAVLAAVPMDPPAQPVKPAVPPASAAPEPSPVPSPPAAQPVPSTSALRPWVKGPLRPAASKMAKIVEPEPRPADPPAPPAITTAPHRMFGTEN